MSKCRACQTNLENDLDQCSVCACPTNISRWEVKNWNVAKKRMNPEMPTIMGSGEFVKSAKCPFCNLIMYIKDIECPHCSHLLIAAEKEKQKLYSREQSFKGYKLGAVFTIGFILLFTVLFGI